MSKEENEKQGRVGTYNADPRKEDPDEDIGVGMITTLMVNLAKENDEWTDLYWKVDTGCTGEYSVVKNLHNVTQVKKVVMHPTTGNGVGAGKVTHTGRRLVYLRQKNGDIVKIDLRVMIMPDCPYNLLNVDQLKREKGIWWSNQKEPSLFQS